ncbi:MAG: high-affinity iron transporter, partial [Acidobacteriota bacterium]|nr:high-affinity iron transporter [Acidobacteriota bacterium]
AADLRLARAAGQRQGRARVLGATLGIVIVAILGLGFVYAQPPAALSSATPVILSNGAVRIPLASFQGETLRRFVVQIDGHPVRFIAVPVDQQGHIATAFDACVICGPRGYYQEGKGIFCLHCGSVINPASIGRQGGCNPIPLNSRVEGGDLVLGAADLKAGVSTFATAAAPRM